MSEQDSGSESIPTDYEIAQNTEMKPIGELAGAWGLDDDSPGKTTEDRHSPDTETKTER